MKKYQLILFDLDGTLLDSRTDIAIAANAGLQQAGLDTLPEDVISSYVGSGAVELIERTLGRSLGLEADRALIKNVHESFKNYYRDHCLDNTQLFSGVRKDLLKLSHHYKLGLFTNKSRIFANPILKGLHLYRLFDVVLCGGDEVQKKPHPEGFFVASRLTHIPLKKILYVGDSRIDAQAAASAGVDLALVTYGFESVAELAHSKAIGRFKNFSDLNRVLMAHPKSN